MRTYKNDGTPGDPAELDPCLAAEARASKNACTRRRLQLILCLVLLVLIITFLILGVVYLAVSKDDLKPAPTDPPSPSRRDQNAPTPLLQGAGIKPVIVPILARHKGGAKTPAKTTPSPTEATTTDVPVMMTTEDEEEEEELPEDVDEEQNEPLDEETTPRPKDDEEEIEEVEELASTASSTTEETTEEPTTTTETPSTTVEWTTTEEPEEEEPTDEPTSLPSSVQTSTSEFSKVSENVYSDCFEIGKEGMPTGVYTLAPEDEEFDALCDSDTDGGGWTVIQRRADAKTYFYNRSWEDYERGFGEPAWNHWLGLSRVHQLIQRSGRPLTLRIEIRGDLCSDNTRCSGQTDGFWWSDWDFSTSYTLSISPVKAGNLSTELYDPFYSTNNGQPFTAMNRDNDKASSYNCAQFRNFGAWWHNDCSLVALNGLYGDDKPRLRYQVWFHQAALSMDTYYIHPRVSTMKIRPQ